MRLLLVCIWFLSCLGPNFASIIINSIFSAIHTADVQIEDVRGRSWFSVTEIYRAQNMRIGVIQTCGLSMMEQSETRKKPDIVVPIWCFCQKLEGNYLWYTIVFLLVYGRVSCWFTVESLAATSLTDHRYVFFVTSVTNQLPNMSYPFLCLLLFRIAIKKKIQPGCIFSFQMATLKP